MIYETRLTARSGIEGPPHEPRSEEFVEQAKDRLDAAREALAAGHAQVAREGGDYQAVTPSKEEAERYVAGATDFLAAAEQILGS